jgi:hypothetical protein
LSDFIFPVANLPSLNESHSFHERARPEEDLDGSKTERLHLEKKEPDTLYKNQIKGRTEPQ